MHPIKLALIAAVACCSVPAMAQWQWIDGQGRKVFSDRAPPPDIPGKNILRQPGSAASRQAAAPAAPSGTAAATTVAAAPAQPTAQPADKGVDKALEEQKRKQEEQEAAKVRAEQQQREKQRQDNCARARQSKTALASGQLLAYSNAKGERGFMDDATREAEIKHTEAVIASNCGPAQ
jgi:type IV secretory pathway VirB10-like protein